MSSVGSTGSQSEGLPPAQGKAGGGEGCGRRGGGQVPGSEEDGGDREGEDTAVLPERPHQSVPRKFHSQGTAIRCSCVAASICRRQRRTLWGAAIECHIILSVFIIC